MYGIVQRQIVKDRSVLDWVWCGYTWYC